MAQAHELRRGKEELPSALLVIESVAAQFPGIMQGACFDITFLCRLLADPEERFNFCHSIDRGQ
jgi:hypothetical protein